MVEVMVQVPEELREKFSSLSPWFPSVVELVLQGYQTPSALETAGEVVRFLSSGPTPTQVAAFHASEQTMTRLNRLLALNRERLLSDHEEKELDELQNIDHLVIKLKARAHSALAS